MFTLTTQCIRGVLDPPVSTFSLSLYRHPFLYTLFTSRFTLIINNIQTTWVHLSLYSYNKQQRFSFPSLFACSPSIPLPIHRLLVRLFSIAALPSVDVCAQPPPVLRCSTRPAPRTLTEDSHRDPYQAGVGNLPRHTLFFSHLLFHLHTLTVSKRRHRVVLCRHPA